MTHRNANHPRPGHDLSGFPQPDRSVQQPTGQPLRLSTPLHLSAQETDGAREYRAAFIKAGTIRAQGNRESNLTIPARALEQAAPLFAARPTFVDHAGWFDHPSLRNLAGITVNAAFDPAEEEITGTIRLYDTAAADVIRSLFDAVLEDQATGGPVPDVGLSAVLWPKWQRVEVSDDVTIWEMSEIRHVESVDFVFEPGAEGRVKEALIALSALVPETAAGRLPAGTKRPALEPNPPGELDENGTNQTRMEVTPMSERKEKYATEPPAEAAPAAPVEGTPPDDGIWFNALKHNTAEAMIAVSGLPAAAKDRLRAQTYDDPEQVESAIEAERAYLAELVAPDVVQVGSRPPRGSQVSVGRTGTEQLHAAFEALILGTLPPAGVQPLSGVREFYHLLSGDFEMHGLFQPDRVYLANVTSSTMSNMTANVLNKAVINAFMEYPLWWRPIVSEDDFQTLQQVKWITLGGVGELPTVAEGAAYTELAWDDAAETADFVKKGGYLGITLEAIDKDDTRRLRAAPRALAQSAWLTLSKAVSAIFTAGGGVGPTLSDSVALFNAANHGNLLTTALSWSQYITVRTAMMKQTEVNSGERLGFLTAPKYLLVPIDLEITALQVMASEGQPGSADNDENPFAEGDGHAARMRSARDRVIVVPDWTDTNNWAAVADPMLYPSIGIGYRYGRMPEVFSVASPTAGLMFTNDTLPVKVRFFFAVGPTDYRGLHKSNVT